MVRINALPCWEAFDGEHTHTLSLFHAGWFNNYPDLLNLVFFQMQEYTNRFHILSYTCAGGNSKLNSVMRLGFLDKPVAHTLPAQMGRGVPDYTAMVLGRS